jgi:hypothetical protein
MRRDPSALPDTFYVRVGAALEGRLPGYKILPSLLPALAAAAYRKHAVRATPARGTVR